MPTATPGSIEPSTQPSQVRRQAHAPTKSWTIISGSKIAAPVTGEMTSATSGRASEPTPENPPLLKPSKITAGIAKR